MGDGMRLQIIEVLVYQIWLIVLKKEKKLVVQLILLLHVLEIMEGILISSQKTHQYIKLTTSCEKPEYLSEEEIKDIKN